MYGTVTNRGIGSQHPMIHHKRKESVNYAPIVVGLGLLAASYAVAGALIVADGPLPFGDAIALGILAVPDVVWFGIGYAIAG